MHSTCRTGPARKARQGLGNGAVGSDRDPLPERDASGSRSATPNRSPVAPAGAGSLRPLAATAGAHTGSSSSWGGWASRRPDSQSSAQMPCLLVQDPKCSRGLRWEGRTKEVGLGWLGKRKGHRPAGEGEEVGRVWEERGSRQASRLPAGR